MHRQVHTLITIRPVEYFDPAPRSKMAVVSGVAADVDRSQITVFDGVSQSRTNLHYSAAPFGAHAGHDGAHGRIALDRHKRYQLDIDIKRKGHIESTGIRAGRVVVWFAPLVWI
jgi:hypothetical protein